MASRIAEILLRAKLIDDLQLRSALGVQSQWGGRLAHIVVERHFANEEAVSEAIAQALKLPKVDLAQVDRDAAALGKVDLEFARDKMVFPCALKDGGRTLWLAMADPTDVPTVDELALKSRVRIKLVVASERQIQDAIRRSYLGEAQPAGNQAYGAFTSIDASTGDEEGKIVDMSGHTLVKNIKDLVGTSGDEPRPAPAPLPATPEARSATGDMLDDLMGAGGKALAWSATDLARLKAIQDQQEKGARILRTVLDLCVRKGLFKPEDYRLKLKKT
jgi:hypothetical protein